MFSGTPSANNIDAVVGLSNGAASKWTNLAAIVRFSPAGILDVRKGGAYAADVTMTYSAGTTYKFRMDVNVKTHIYSVYVADVWGTWRPLAKDYPFRTEQASVTSLNNIASYLEPSRAGSLNLCGVEVVHDDSFGNDCLGSEAGATFSNIRLTATTGVLMTHFVAVPSAANMDGVVGFALGSVDAYNDYAASVRFATNGMIEARDGDGYRADVAFPYQPGTQYQFHVIIDIPSKTYSVEVASDYAYFVEIARSYKFRPQQAAITGLDHAATIVASATGHVEACALRNESWAGLKFAHRGYARVTPLSNGNLAITDDAQTYVTNADGATLYVGAPTGVVALDGNDNLFIARSADGILTLASYTSSLALRWTRTYAIEGRPGPIGVYTDGTIAVAIENRALVTFRSDGSMAGSQNIAQLSPTAVAISPWGFGVVRVTSDGMTVESYTPAGQLVWQRFWRGTFAIEEFVPNMAAFVLTGQFYTTIDFGDGVMEPISNPETTRNTFLLSLNANGLLTFSKRLWTSYSTGLDADGSHIAVSTQDWTQTPWMGFSVFDNAGNGLFGFGGGAAPGQEGFTQGIAIAPNGRAFVNMAPKWSPSGLAPPWEHLFAVEGP